LQSPVLVNGTGGQEIIRNRLKFVNSVIGFVIFIARK
jgi:hypothetical protein